MKMEQALGSPSQGENENHIDSPSHPLFQWSGTGHAPAEDPISPSGDENEVASSSVDAKKLPIQKRRRVTRACDECRRKKIKCDGKQPCTHCTVYSYG